MPCSRASRRSRWSTNSPTATPPGSRHERRWQDVVELLDAGIDVYTTINIQHLESLNDVVHPHHRRARQRDRARHRVRPPARHRAGRPAAARTDRAPAQGKVYVPEQAAQALQAFFSPSNLTRCASWRCRPPPTASTATCAKPRPRAACPGMSLRRRRAGRHRRPRAVGIPGARGAPPRRTPRRAVDRRHGAGRACADGTGAAANSTAPSPWRAGSAARPWSCTAPTSSMRCSTTPDAERRVDHRPRPHPRTPVWRACSTAR